MRTGKIVPRYGTCPLCGKEYYCGEYELYIEEETGEEDWLQHTESPEHREKMYIWRKIQIAEFFGIARSLRIQDLHLWCLQCIKEKEEDLYRLAEAADLIKLSDKLQRVIRAAKKLNLREVRDDEYYW